MTTTTEEQKPTHTPNGNGSQQSTAIVQTAPAPAALESAPQSATLMAPFSSEVAFVAAQRMARALASSTLVPQAYRENISNTLIAMELASRIGVSVLAAMQNLDVIHGTPSWRAKFLIATVNATKRFTPLRFEWKGTEGKEDWGCRAYARSREDGELCIGPWVTWKMAVDEGWATKSGSKWKTLGELMFPYRAGAFWARLFAPEIGLGFHTTEEVIDVHGETTFQAADLPSQLTPGSAKALEATLGISTPDVEDTALANQDPVPTSKAQAKAAAAVSGGKQPAQQQTIDTK